MTKKFFFLALLLCIKSSFMSASPPAQIPPEYLDAFTLGGKIPYVLGYYYDEAGHPGHPRFYSKEEINLFIAKVLRKETNYYGATDTYLYQAISSTIRTFNGKSVCILGSATSWYESIALAFKGKPISIDYNPIISDDPRINALTVEEYSQNPIQFDYIISISSLEHDGLGRYGDPINPNGDLEAMKNAKKMLKPGGLLFLAVPVGYDLITWNAHRIYGKLRLPLLLEGWEVLATFGFNESDLYREVIMSMHQPVFVLRPIN